LPVNIFTFIHQKLIAIVVLKKQGTDTQTNKVQKIRKQELLQTSFKVIMQRVCKLATRVYLVTLV